MKTAWVLFLLLVGGSAFGGATPQSHKRVFDLGEGEVVGDLKRPQLKWVDSSLGMRKLLPQIHARRFADLQAQLLKPWTRAQWNIRVSKKAEKGEVRP